MNRFARDKLCRRKHELHCMRTVVTKQQLHRHHQHQRFEKPYSSSASRGMLRLQNHALGNQCQPKCRGQHHEVSSLLMSQTRGCKQRDDDCSTNQAEARRRIWPEGYACFKHSKCPFSGHLCELPKTDLRDPDQKHWNVRSSVAYSHSWQRQPKLGSIRNCHKPSI